PGRARRVPARFPLDLFFPLTDPPSGRAAAGTCGHDRPTAAARCAEVRSAMRPAVPPKVAGLDHACRVAERASLTLRRPETQLKWQSPSNQGSLLATKGR